MSAELSRKIKDSLQIQNIFNEYNLNRSVIPYFNKTRNGPCAINKENKRKEKISLLIVKMQVTRSL